MIISLLKKELQLIGRGLHGILSMFVLSFTLLFLFHFSFEKDASLPIISLVGIKWSILFITSYVLIGQSTWEERESGAGQIVQIFVPNWLIFLIKSFVVWIFLVFVLCLVAMGMKLMFSNFSIIPLLNHLLFIIPGSLSLAFLGVSLGSIAASTRMKEVILPLLLIPFSIPIFLFGLKSEFRYISDASSLNQSVFLMIFFCFFYGALGALFQELQSENIDG